MAVLAECPMCHRKQATKNKLCSSCGSDLDKLKRGKKVHYWIDYRLPSGKTRREHVGTSVEEARDANGKRRGQKRENRIFDILPESKMSFEELAGWYLKLKSVQKLSSFGRVEDCLKNFNKFLGNRIVNTLKAEDLENYQDHREKQGAAPATIDMEISVAKTMANKAFDNDKVDGRILKAFRRIKRKLKKGSNARDRTLSPEEYLGLQKEAPPHLQAILTVAYNTGMRIGELINLRWSYIDREKWFIRLPADETKEGKPKSIPLNQKVREILGTLPRHVHHDHVFTYKGQPISTRTRRSLKTACKNANIPHGRKDPKGFVFHDIRSTVKTNMLRAGVDKALRDVILGHSLQGMDAFYLKPSDDDLHGAMGKYTTWLDNQLTQVVANLDQTLDQASEKG